MSYSQTDTGALKNAIILSAKAGYHTGFNTDEVRFGFPTGPVFDISGEFHLGKGWYLGMGYDFWWTEDKVNDDYFGEVMRNNKGSDFVSI